MSSTAPMRVASAQGDYTVEQYDDVDSLVDSLAAIPNAFFIVDELVADLYASSFQRLANRPMHRMPATEAEKTLHGIERGLLALQAAGGNKRTTVVGIGGGIVQDVSTLVAHLWYRGVDFVYVPTTLLAMADSCIGAKSAVNLGSFKNQIGTFQSPKRVLACDRFISTLTDEAVMSGYGEIVKLAIVESPEAVATVRADIERDGMRSNHVGKHVRMSLETKRRVIEIDEYEVGLRKTLNFGHTFGHALESTVDNEVPHGLAVVWGVDVAGYVASRLGQFDQSTYADLHEFLHRAFHMHVTRPYTALELVNAMRRDKKAVAGEVALILPHRIGELAIVPTPIDATLTGFIADYLATQDLFAA
jgi:3-dehydroquinate synthase